LAGNIALIVVDHMVREEQRDEIIRIISARKATAKELKRYDENRAEDLDG